MEEDATLFTKPHLVQQQYINAQFQANNPTNRGKSCSHFFLKCILIALFLSLLPLFPSEPPGFISNTVFAKTWELLHLLIIGIALSYGLFCRLKTPQTPTKPQISQPYAPSILQHSSIFDYEEGSTSGVSDNNAIPTQSFNLSHYRTEPFVVSNRKNYKNFNDRPLGLPVRSLRSTVVSDSEEEVCASECDYDSNVDNSSSTSEEDGKNLEGNVGNFPPNLGKSQSMRDFSMAKNGKFEGKQLNVESFRSPVPAASSSCQKFSGFCSWLPESPDMGRENGWSENNFYMPFSNYNQVNDYNTVGVPPNLQNTANFYMPPASVHPSMPFSSSDFATYSRNYSHDIQHWSNVNYENRNMRVDNSEVSMPSTSVPPSMPVPPNDFASRSRRHNPESEHWSKSPDLQTGTSGGGSPDHFMPLAAFSRSIPTFTDNSASPVKKSETPNFNRVPSRKKKDDMRSENNNMALGRENTEMFMPPAAFSPSVPTFADDSASVNTSKNTVSNHMSSLKKKDEIRSDGNNLAFGSEITDMSMPSVPTFAYDYASSVKTSKNSMFNHVSSLKKKNEMRPDSNDVALGRENKGISMPSAAFSPSMPDYASSVKASKNTDFNHVSSLKIKDEIRSAVISGEQKNNIFMPQAVLSPSMPMPADDSTPIKVSKNVDFNHVSSFKKKDEIRSANNEQKTNIFMPPAALSPSMPVSAHDSTPIKASKNAEFNYVSSLKKKDETRSEKNNVTLGGQEANVFKSSAAFSPLMSVSADESARTVKATKNSKFNRVPSVKKKYEMKSENNNEALGEENTNIFMPPVTITPSMPDSTDKFSSSVRRSKSKRFNHDSSLKKKDEISSKGNNVTAGSFQDTNNSCTPHYDDLLSGGKSAKLENEDLGDGKPKFLKNTAEVLPSVHYAVDQFASSLESPRNKTFNHKASVRQDEERSKTENVGSIEEKIDSNTPHFINSISFPSSRVDVPPEKNEQRGSIPEKWSDDCFQIPPSEENNDVGDVLLENLSLSIADPSEAWSLAGTSSRRSSHGQETPQNRVNEHVPWSAQMNNLEIENVMDDVLRENDSYKPSTPSPPPPRAQARINDYVASSVESSSRTLGNQSLLKDDDFVNQGSPPTPERRKALSRAYHSKKFSCGSFFDRDLRKSYKDEVKGANKKTKGDEDQFSRGGKCGWDCLKLDIKPALNKPALRGKSVRTIKPKEISQDRQKNDHIELKCIENNEGLTLANGEERKGDKSETVVIKIGISEKRSNSRGRKGEKLQGNGGTTSILVGLNSKQNPNGTATVLDDVKEEVNDGEIDRKADEFIAKFKEQIRLQKVAPGSTLSRQHKNSM